MGNRVSRLPRKRQRQAALPDLRTGPPAFTATAKLRARRLAGCRSRPRPLEARRPCAALPAQRQGRQLQRRGGLLCWRQRRLGGAERALRHGPRGELGGAGRLRRACSRVPKWACGGSDQGGRGQCASWLQAACRVAAGACATHLVCHRRVAHGREGLLGSQRKAGGGPAAIPWEWVWRKDPSSHRGGHSKA